MGAGKRFIIWNGIEPRLCLTETELIKELLSKYSTLSGKSWLQQQGSKHFIGKGLLMANGNDWYHQRHIVAPAFMGDKLKVIFFKKKGIYFVFSINLRIIFKLICGFLFFWMKNRVMQVIWWNVLRKC